MDPFDDEEQLTITSPTNVNEVSLRRTLFERVLIENLIVNIDYTYYLPELPLLSNLPEVPDDFWEPVKVGLKREYLDEFESIEIEPDTNLFNCFICSLDSSSYKILPCCNKEMCSRCVKKWFKESVYCPFCKQDIRDLYQIEYTCSTDSTGSTESIGSQDEIFIVTQELPNNFDLPPHPGPPAPPLINLMWNTVGTDRERMTVWTDREGMTVGNVVGNVVGIEEYLYCSYSTFNELE
jgi:hypothetical protein